MRVGFEPTSSDYESDKLTFYSIQVDGTSSSLGADSVTKRPCPQRSQVAT